VHGGQRPSGPELTCRSCSGSWRWQRALITCLHPRKLRIFTSGWVGRLEQRVKRPLNFAFYGRTRPAQTAFRTALPRRLLIRKRSRHGAWRSSMHGDGGEPRTVVLTRPSSERLTSPLTVRNELGKRRSAQGGTPLTRTEVSPTPRFSNVMSGVRGKRWPEGRPHVVTGSWPIRNGDSRRGAYCASKMRMCRRLGIAVSVARRWVGKAVESAHIVR